MALIKTYIYINRKVRCNNDDSCSYQIGIKYDIVEPLISTSILSSKMKHVHVYLNHDHVAVLRNYINMI